MLIEDSQVPKIYLQEPGHLQRPRDAWRYTMRQEWSTDIESAWMRISKFALYNRLTHAEICRLLIPNEPAPFKNSVALRVAGRLDCDRASKVLRIDPKVFAASFCCDRLSPSLRLVSRELRYCRPCLDAGFHAAWFQWKFVERCPIHNKPIRSGCPRCRAPIDYAIDSALATSPLRCVRCQMRWVRRLDKPAGSCTPIERRHRNIHRRWDQYVRNAVARNSALGRVQTEFLRELNRVFDLPPPVPEDIINMGIHDKVEPIDRRTIPTAAQLVAFDRLRWPGFGKQFKQAEIVTLGVIALSLKEAAIDRSIDKSRRRLHFSADYLTADQAGTLGWAISWGGRSNVLTPLDAERQPALGLAGWLANLPHRPRNLSTVRWQSQIINWLRTDLSNSAETWQRICKAMSTQNQFVLEPGVCPPSVYARRH